MTPSAVPSRRDLFFAAAASAAFTSGCGTELHHAGRLRYLLRRDINTFDPAQAAEVWLQAAIFEPLIQPHPETMAPMAGLATHYLIEHGGTRYTFYLRGHAAPQGIRLDDAASLPAEFSRGRTGAPSHQAARWSDGVTITAEDCVHSWRRFIAPATGNTEAYTFYCIAGAEAVSAGKIPPEDLGVRAVDRFAFHVDLREPAPYFPMLCFNAYVTPRHVIEEAQRGGREASWTDVGRIVTSGPFQLKEHRPHERTVVSRNPGYYDAHMTGVDEIEFSSADGVVVLNLFRAGLADSMEGRVLPLQLTPRMKGNPALHVSPALACHNWRINTWRPPWDNPILRYALNMATDKEATARFLGMGQLPAKSRVPPLTGYAPPESLQMEINGQVCDVLAFNPRAAGELWRAAAPPAGGPITIHYPARMDSHLLAEIQQAQWAQHLGMRTTLQAQEPAAYVQSVLEQGEFSGVAEDSYAANFPDPQDFLSLYASDYPNWSDPKYAAKLAAAGSIANPTRRLEALTRCEAALMRAMPLVPLYFDTWVYLERPEVRGLRLSPMGVPAFKYAWIESNRRTQ